MSLKLKFFPIPAPEFATYEVGGIIPKADFIRFAPTATMSDTEIEETKLMLEAAGAKVKILPRIRARKTVSKVKVKPKLLGPRVVVKTLIENSNSKQKRELEESCQARMDEAHV
jgi:hypothetical protein